MVLAIFLMLTASVAAPVEAAPGVVSAARFDHLALHVADVAKSVAFYRRHFGMSEIPAPVIGPRWLSLGGAAALHLIPGRTAPVVDNRNAHLAVAVGDFDAMLGRLRADGVTFTDFRGNAGVINRVRGDGVRQIFLRDPDGYWIEVNDVANS